MQTGRKYDKNGVFFDDDDAGLWSKQFITNKLLAYIINLSYSLCLLNSKDSQKLQKQSSMYNRSIFKLRG
jgi:hypothetical protein